MLFRSLRYGDLADAAAGAEVEDLVAAAVVAEDLADSEAATRVEAELPATGKHPTGKQWNRSFKT